MIQLLIGWRTIAYPYICNSDVQKKATESLDTLSTLQLTPLLYMTRSRAALNILDGRTP